MAASLAPSDFRSVMRASVSGVSVVTTDGPAGRFGLTVSSLTSISLDPATVMVSILNKSPALPAILGNRLFNASILAADQAPISDTFAGRGPDGRRHDFGIGTWQVGANGAPVLQSALAVLQCKLSQVLEMHDHTLVFGLVAECHSGMDADDFEKIAPLVFYKGRYCEPAAA